MKREDKNILSRKRIIEAALQEFSAKGYEGASLNTVWSEKGISKGIIYHYFKDKDEIYLLCVQMCFDALTAYLRERVGSLQGTAEECLQAYFNARICFFAENPLYLGIFSDAAFQPPASLSEEIAQRRHAFDELNICVLTELLDRETLRPGLCVKTIVEDFRVYMDFFNLRFKPDWNDGRSRENLLKEHEERCHRQLDILLHGVLGD